MQMKFQKFFDYGKKLLQLWEEVIIFVGRHNYTCGSYYTCGKTLLPHWIQLHNINCAHPGDGLLLKFNSKKSKVVMTPSGVYGRSLSLFQ